MQTDLIGWGGLALGIVSFIYAIRTNCRANQRLDIAHAGLVSLKTGIQGENKDEVKAAINDLLQKLQR